MTRRVDEVDAVFAPREGDRGSGDADAPLAFLRQAVRHRVTVMHFTHCSCQAAVEQKPLSDSCFAGVDVRYDAYVPYFAVLAGTTGWRAAVGMFVGGAPSAARGPSEGH